MISFQNFLNIDMRLGRIVEAEDFPQARKPAYRLKIDFGEEVGIKSSSAQITAYYSKEELRGRLVIAVVNFPPKQVATFISEVLVLGVYDAQHNVVLLGPDKKGELKLGSRVG